MADARLPVLMVDLETTCIDPDTDDSAVLEIGAAVVSPDLDVVARASWVVPYSPAEVARLREFADPFVRDMHDASGLWAACATAGFLHPPCIEGRKGGVAELWAPISNWVCAHVPDPAVPLAGSSVHFDAGWLREFDIPLLYGVDPDTGREKPRTHRLADVSAVREWLARWSPGIVEAAPGSRRLHRVDPDLDDTISEARYYRDALGFAPLTPSVPVMDGQTEIGDFIVDGARARSCPKCHGIGSSTASGLCLDGWHTGAP